MMQVEPWINFLLAQFGKNPHGQNVYRVIWSEDVFAMEYGKQVKFYGEGKDRWMLEKWMPPEMYDREQWKSEVVRDSDGLIVISPQGEITYALGPFPEKGLYEHCYTFEGADGQYCPVETGILSLICQCIEKGLMKTEGERMAALKAKREKEEKAREDLFHDVWLDAAPAPGAKLPDHCERIESFDIQRQMEEAGKGMPDGFSQISAAQANKQLN